MAPKKTKAATKKASAKPSAASKRASTSQKGMKAGTAKKSSSSKRADKAGAQKRADTTKGSTAKNKTTKSAGSKTTAKSAAKTTSAGKSSAKRRSASDRTDKKIVSDSSDRSQTPPQPKGTRVTPASTSPERLALPKPRFSKDGMGYTKDFPLPFIKQAYEDLQAERVRLTGQANRLEQEAHQLVEDSEMGDVQFDDEGGEGDTLAVEREQDLTLSAQARETVREIDEALARIQAGTYGYSTLSGQPIPTERLEAIPWSSVLVEEKVGGIGRR